MRFLVIPALCGAMLSGCGNEVSQTTASISGKKGKSNKQRSKTYSVKDKVPEHVASTAKANIVPLSIEPEYDAKLSLRTQDSNNGLLVSPDTNDVTRKQRKHQLMDVGEISGLVSGEKQMVVGPAVRLRANTVKTASSKVVGETLVPSGTTVPKRVRFASTLEEYEPQSIVDTSLSTSQEVDGVSGKSVSPKKKPKWTVYHLTKDPIPDVSGDEVSHPTPTINVMDPINTQESTDESLPELLSDEMHSSTSHDDGNEVSNFHEPLASQHGASHYYDWGNLPEAEHYKAHPEYFKNDFSPFSSVPTWGSQQPYSWWDVNTAGDYLHPQKEHLSGDDGQQEEETSSD